MDALGVSSQGDRGLARRPGEGRNSGRAARPTKHAWGASAPVLPAATGASPSASATGPPGRSSTSADGAPEDLARYAAGERAHRAEVVRGGGTEPE